MPTFTVVTPINHDGHQYAPGDTITLTDEHQIATLLEGHTIASREAAPVEEQTDSEQVETPQAPTEDSQQPTDTVAVGENADGQPVNAAGEVVPPVAPQDPNAPEEDQKKPGFLGGLLGGNRSLGGDPRAVTGDEQHN